MLGGAAGRAIYTATRIFSLECGWKTWKKGTEGGAGEGGRGGGIEG